MKVKNWFVGLTLCAVMSAWAQDAAPRRGSEAGNGGDPVALEFVKEAQEIASDLDRLGKDRFPEITGERLREVIRETQLRVSDRPLVIAGNQVTAMNIPADKLIVVNRARWKEMTHLPSRRGLVFHEYLGVLGLESNTYGISARYLLAVHSGSGPAEGLIYADAEEMFNKGVVPSASSQLRGGDWERIGWAMGFDGIEAADEEPFDGQDSLKKELHFSVGSSPLYPPNALSVLFSFRDTQLGGSGQGYYPAWVRPAGLEFAQKAYARVREPGHRSGDKYIDITDTPVISKGWTENNRPVDTLQLDYRCKLLAHSTAHLICQVRLNARKGLHEYPQWVHRYNGSVFRYEAYEFKTD